MGTAGIDGKSQTIRRPLTRTHPNGALSAARHRFYGTWSWIVASVHRIFRRQYWTREAAALIGGAVVIIVLSCLLRRFDGKKFSAWTAPITLNALMSLLVTVLYILLTTILSKCIHQMRWLYFDKPHALSDVQLFDSVQDGGFGALRYLLRLPRSARLGLAAILGLAITSIGPLTQQILQIDTADFLEAGRGNLPVAYKFQYTPSDERTSSDPSSDSSLSATNKLQIGVQGAISVGLFASTAHTEFLATPQCTSGNCTWDSYATLVMQSETQDVTDLLIVSSPEEVADRLQNPAAVTSQHNISQHSNGTIMPWQAVSLPSSTCFAPGITVNLLQTLLAQELLSGLPNSTSSIFGNLPLTVFVVQPLVSIVGIGQSQLMGQVQRFHIYFYELEVDTLWNGTGSVENLTITNGKIGAWDCTFNITVQPLKSQEVNGAFTEQAIAPPVLYDGPMCDSQCNYTWGESTFWYDTDTALLVTEYMETFFDDENGFGMVNFSLPDNLLPGKPTFTFPVSLFNVTHPVSSSILYGVASNEVNSVASNSQIDPSQPFLTMSDVMDNVARSMTSWMREFSGQNVSGSVHRTYPVYRVEWGWLSIPLAILVLTAALVTVTATDTRRKGLPTWTDSTLPLVVLDVASQARPDLAKIRDAGELEEACKKLKVYLNPNSLILETAQMEQKPGLRCETVEVAPTADDPHAESLKVPVKPANLTITLSDQSSDQESSTVHSQEA